MITTQQWDSISSSAVLAATAGLATQVQTAYKTVDAVLSKAGVLVPYTPGNNNDATAMTLALQQYRLAGWSVEVTIPSPTSPTPLITDAAQIRLRPQDNIQLRTFDLPDTWFTAYYAVLATYA